jgi:hypothetical protein
VCCGWMMHAVYCVRRSRSCRRPAAGAAGSYSKNMYMSPCFLENISAATAEFCALRVFTMRRLVRPCVVLCVVC